MYNLILALGSAADNGMVHSSRFTVCMILGKAQITVCTDKNEYKIFLIYSEIQSGAVAKSYMRKAS
jgi:hypothetical protein